MATKASNSPLLNEEQAWIRRQENYEHTQAFNAFQEMMVQDAIARHIPYKGTFELTPRCSMRCRMCYMRLDPPQIRKQGKELTADEWIVLAKEAFTAGTFDLTLTGGEPMLRPDFPKIYEAISEMGFLLRVFTNLTRVTPATAKLLKERPPQSLEVTLYGASAETYARLGGWDQGFERAVRALDDLLPHMPSIHLKTTITRDNAMDYPWLSQFAKDRGLSLDTTSQPMPAVRGATSSAITDRLSPDELIAFEDANGFVLQDRDSINTPLEKRCGVMCPSGQCIYTVQWNGDMVACNVDDNPLRVIGHPLEEGFLPAFLKLQPFANDKPMPEPCKTCPVYGACGTCAVRHRTESGRYDVPGRYLCDFARKRYGLETLPDSAFEGFPV